MRKSIIFIFLSFIAVHSFGQFTGPRAAGAITTAEQALNARVGTYVTLVGFVVEHVREDYYTFRDASGQIRVQIEQAVWQGRQIGPEKKVRLQGEIDRGVRGRYVWVERLQLVE